MTTTKARDTKILTKGRRVLDPGRLPAACGFEPYDELWTEYALRADLDYTKAAGATGTVVREIAEAREEHPKRVYNARLEEREEPEDPFPALYEKSRLAEQELEVQALRMIELSDKIEALQSDPDFREYAKELVRKRVDKIEKEAGKLSLVLHDLDDDLAIRSWTQGGSGKRGLRSSRVRAAFDTFRTELDGYREQRPVVNLSPVEYAKFRNGEDVTDRDGNPYTQEEAQELRRLGLLKVHHGRLRSVGRPS
jgi:hypothetical protein